MEMIAVLFVTPAQAGVRILRKARNFFLDSGLRRNDGSGRSFVKSRLVVSLE